VALSPFVIAGLDPAIRDTAPNVSLDARVKPGHDDP
jgi:hypothetical protein